jgi:hypothetical protein
MDITMCSGDKCPLKEKCVRFTANPNGHRQSYFMSPPFTIKDKLFNCDFLWTPNQTSILDQLETITNGKEK